MSELIFVRRGEEVMYYHLDDGVTRIGRGPQNDIAFPEHEQNISRYHALLQERQGLYWLRDLTGQGLTLNDKIVHESLLRDGDEFELGKWRVIFRVRERGVGQTLITRGDSTLPMAQATPQDAEQCATLQYTLQEQKFEFILGENPVNIGKSEQNDIQIDDPHASGFHCRIFFRKGRYYIRDLDSLNGTWVNGLKQVEGELPDKAEIYVGRFPLQFSLERDEVESPAPTTSTTEYPGFSGIVSQDPGMERLFKMLQRIADNDEAPVLITGESGTGKELIARAIHLAGGRAKKPFVALNCGAISKDLIESTLFGHEKGAFTGAIEGRKGAFEEAADGTIFLDELGDLPLEQQVSLLRVLELGTFRRIGGNQELQSRARVLTATHRSLPQRIQDGLFREDLFYRVNVLQVHIPPLRQRTADIPLLMDYFLQKFAGPRQLEFTQAAIEKAQQYNWPGNVRELKNVIQRAIVLVEGQSIYPQDLHFQGNMDHSTPPPQALSTPHTPRGTASLEETERQAILDALEQCQGVVSEAARLLGIGRSSMYNKMKRLNIQHRKLKQ
tara:strand:+ start:131 stop:1801 length:1671 start_codon:yes stop_codon:yes gene_type:complete